MKKSVIYSLHAIVISFFLVMLVTLTKNLSVRHDESYVLSFLDIFLHQGAYLVLFYLSYYVFIPKFIIKKEYLKFVLVFFAITVGFMLVFNLTAWSIAEFSDIKFHVFIKRSSLGIFIDGLFFAFAGTTLRLFIQWLQGSIDKKELESKNVKSELALLKNQLNPHFLFNTLNNIDALIIDKSDNASPALNKLSDLMRYMVYDSEQEMVDLHDEIDYIQNYISLQQLRMPNQEIVQFKITGDMRDKHIPPMLLIPFVENAFKHSSLKDNTTNKIEINIDVTDDAFSFACFNVIGKIKKDKSSGVGLALVKKRLDLLYKDKHTLTIDDNGKDFRVHLQLNA